MNACHARGVGHTWLLDALDETLVVHRWHPDGYVEVLIAERHDIVHAEPFGALDLRVGVLLGDDE
jgi:hypothetical protein